MKERREQETEVNDWELMFLSCIPLLPVFISAESANELLGQCCSKLGNNVTAAVHSFTCIVT
jgi:hypothetical protein